MQTNKRIQKISMFVVVSALLFFAGCGGVEDSTYNGKVLLRLSGTVKNNAGKDIGDAPIHVGLVWIFDHGNGDEVSMQDSIVGSQFPANFSLELYSNPADSLLMTFDDMSGGASDDELSKLKELWPQDMKIGLAYIAVWQDMNDDGVFSFSDDGNSDRIVGGSPEYVVMYLEGALPPDSFYTDVLDGLVDGRLHEGYNLLRTNGKRNCYERDGKQVCGSFDQIVPVESTSHVELLLVDDEGLDGLFPNVS